MEFIELRKCRRLAVWLQLIDTLVMWRNLATRCIEIHKTTPNANDRAMTLVEIRKIEGHIGHCLQSVVGDYALGDGAWFETGLEDEIDPTT